MASTSRYEKRREYSNKRNTERKEEGAEKFIGSRQLIDADAYREGCHMRIMEVPEEKRVIIVIVNSHAKMMGGATNLTIVVFNIDNGSFTVIPYNKSAGQTDLCYAEIVKRSLEALKTANITVNIIIKDTFGSSNPFPELTSLSLFCLTSLLDHDLLLLSSLTKKIFIGGDKTRPFIEPLYWNYPVEEVMKTVTVESSKMYYEVLWNKDVRQRGNMTNMAKINTFRDTVYKEPIFEAFKNKLNVLLQIPLVPEGQRKMFKEFALSVWRFLVVLHAEKRSTDDLIAMKAAIDFIKKIIDETDEDEGLALVVKKKLKQIPLMLSPYYNLLSNHHNLPTALFTMACEYEESIDAGQKCDFGKFFIKRLNVIRLGSAPIKKRVENHSGVVSSAEFFYPKLDNENVNIVQGILEEMCVLNKKK